MVSKNVKLGKDKECDQFFLELKDDNAFVQIRRNGKMVGYVHIVFDTLYAEFNEVNLNCNDMEQKNIENGYIVNKHL